MAAIIYELDQLLQLRTSLQIPIDFDFTSRQPPSRQSKWRQKGRWFNDKFNQYVEYEKNFGKSCNYSINDSNSTINSNSTYDKYPNVSYSDCLGLSYYQMEENYFQRVYPVFDFRKLPPGAKVIRVVPGMPVPMGAVKVPVSALKYKQMQLDYVGRCFDPTAEPFEPLSKVPESRKKDEAETQGMTHYMEDSDTSEEGLTTGELVNTRGASPQDEPIMHGCNEFEASKLAEELTEKPDTLQEHEENHSTLDSLDSFNIQIQLPSCGL